MWLSKLPKLKRLCDTSPNLGSDVPEQVFYVLSDKSIFHDRLPVHLEEYFNIGIFWLYFVLLMAVFLIVFLCSQMKVFFMISLYTFRIFSNSLMSLFWG